MLVMLWRQSGRARSLRRNLAIYAAGAAALFLLQFYGPADLFPVRPPPNTPLPELAVSFGETTNVGFSDEREMFGFSTRIDGLPEGWYAIPSPTGARFGAATYTPEPRTHERIRRHLGMPDPGKAGDRALARLCDIDTLYKGMRVGEAITTTSWPRDTLSQQAELEVDLELLLFAYEPIAPPTRVEIIHRVEWGFGFWCELQTPQFRFSRDLASRKQASWQLMRSFAFVLVHKPSRRGVLCNIEGSTAWRGSWSGLPQTSVMFAAEVPEMWPTRTLDELELRVFRRVYRGSTTATIREPNFALHMPSDHSYRDQIDIGEHDRLLPGIPEGDSSALLDLIGTTNHRFSLWEPAPQRLRAIGERDFGELLAHWQRSSNEGQRVLGMIVDDLLDDSRKAELLAALPRHPDLAYLAVARGWEAETRDALLAALATRKRATFRMFQALLLLDDPSVYPAILAKFAQAPSLYLFAALERVPALRPELDRLARESWQGQRSVITLDKLTYDESFKLALRVGDPDALQLMAECLATPESRARYGGEFVGVLRPVLLLPRRESQAIDTLAAGKFRYDTQRRLYLELPP